MNKSNLPNSLISYKYLVGLLLTITQSEFTEIFISGITISIGANILTSVLMKSESVLYFIPGSFLIVSALSCLWFSINKHYFENDYGTPINKPEKFDVEYSKYGKKMLWGIFLFTLFIILSFASLIFLYFHIPPKL